MKTPLEKISEAVTETPVEILQTVVIPRAAFGSDCEGWVVKMEDGSTRLFTTNNDVVCEWDERLLMADLSGIEKCRSALRLIQDVYGDSAQSFSEIFKDKEPEISLKSALEELRAANEKLEAADKNARAATKRWAEEMSAYRKKKTERALRTKTEAAVGV